MSDCNNWYLLGVALIGFLGTSSYVIYYLRSLLYPVGVEELREQIAEKAKSKVRFIHCEDYYLKESYIIEDTESTIEILKKAYVKTKK